jgi:hypothetical protein
MNQGITKPLMTALTIALIAPSAWAQARLELRLRAQDGSPPASVTDIGGSSQWFGAGPRLRFELQYRIVDTDAADGSSPCGLAAATIFINSTQQIGIDLWTLERAQLSRFEAQGAWTTPPTSTDNSGLPTGAMASATGLHMPFRTGIAPPLPNNDAPANGTASGHAITGISPRGIAPGQGPCGAADTGAWFGLYSFDVVAPQSLLADITISALAVPDPGTGATFAYWDALDNPVPRQGSDATVATGTVTGDPGPPPTTTCCNGHICFVVTSFSGCGLATSVGLGSLCGTLPAPCCPADLDNNGLLSLQDLFDFLAFWFASNPRADFNHTGTVTLQDIFDYLAAWFAGCG